MRVKAKKESLLARARKECAREATRKQPINSSKTIFCKNLFSRLSHKTSQRNSMKSDSTSESANTFVAAPKTITSNTVDPEVNESAASKANDPTAFKVCTSSLSGILTHAPN